MSQLDMCITWEYTIHMVKMIQIRNVPDDIHRLLKIRAAQERTTLSELLLREATSLAQRPSIQEIVDRIRSRSSVKPKETSAAAIRAERESRR